jgi:monofunctional biosynthetic peptidoglycan transglycosylase
MSAVALQVDGKLLFDFSSEGRTGRWMIVNDGVMGGLSESELQLSDQGTIIFQGNLSLENYGGFASVRSVPYRFGLEAYDGISLRVLGDGRRYKLRLRTDVNIDGPAYEAEFDTIANTWTTVNIPFQTTTPTYRGRLIKDLPPLSGNRVTQIGLMLADKQEGPFRLEVDWIRAYRTKLSQNIKGQAHLPSMSA